jgi:hypothetical protein
MQEAHDSQATTETTEEMTGPFVVRLHHGKTWVYDGYGPSAGYVKTWKSTPRTIRRAHRLAQTLNDAWKHERETRGLPATRKNPIALLAKYFAGDTP